MARQFANLALFLPTGTGKTATMIRILEDEYRNVGVQSTIIFCPLSVCHQWLTEFKKFSNIPAHCFKVLTGSGKDRVKSLLPLVDQKVPCIVITNYESLNMKEFYPLLLRWQPKIVIADEAHMCKNPHSKRSKNIFPLAYAAKRRFVMTGTPFVNGLEDIFGQYKILNHEIFGGNYYAWRARYFHDVNKNMPRNKYFPDFQPNKNTGLLFSEILARTSIQAKKEDCIDLPPLLKIKIPVELSPAQAKAYNMMEKQFVAELNGATSIAQIALTKSLRLRQIIAGFIADTEDTEKVAWFEDSPRVQALVELLDSIGNEKVIIWTDFKPTYVLLAELMQKLGRTTTFLTGEQSSTEKTISIERFTLGDANTLISNPAAGGTGVNLTQAPYSIYFTKSFNAGSFEQSEARNYRAGSIQHSKVVHYHLISTNTIDEVIHEVLIEKREIGETILGWAKKLKEITLDSDKCNSYSNVKENTL